MLCVGGNMTLTPQVVGQNYGTGTTFNWTGPNSSSSIRNLILNNLQASNFGTYKLRVSYPSTSGCSASGIDSSSVTISQPAGPTILSNSRLQGSSSQSSSFTAGSNIELFTTTNPSNAPIVSYNWVGPNRFTSTAANPIINSIQSNMTGTYSVTVTFGGSCSTTSISSTTISIANFAVEVNSRLEGSSTTSTSFCAGSNVELFATTSPVNQTPTAYKWTGPNGFISTVANPVISNIQPNNGGAYSVTVTFNGNSNDTATATRVISVINYQFNAFARRANVTDNASIFCGGSNVELYVSGNVANGASSSYVWSGPNNFISTSAVPAISNYQPINAGLYNLSLTLDGASCQRTYNSTRTLFYSDTTATLTTAGPSPFRCVGENVTLLPYLVRQNYGPATIYSWTGPNGYTSTSLTPTINNLQENNFGRYSLTATYTSTSGCATSGVDTSGITISKSLPIISAFTRVQGTLDPTLPEYCLGSAIELFAYSNSSLANTTSYSWTGPNGFTSTISNPLINNLDSSKIGTYYVTVTFGGACAGTKTASTSISLRTFEPFIFARRVGETNPTNLFCSGSSLVLNQGSNAPNPPSGVSITSYNWSGPNGFTSTLSMPTISNFQIVDTGLYSLTLTVGGNCVGSYVATTAIKIGNPELRLITPSPSTDLCLGQNVTFLEQTAGSYSQLSTFSWTGPNGFTSTMKNPTINNLQEANFGIYNVTVTYPNTSGCSLPGVHTSNATLTNSTPSLVILPNQDKTVGLGINFPLNIKLLKGNQKLPISLTLSNGSIFTIIAAMWATDSIFTDSIFTAITNMPISQTITITNISSSCGVGSGSGSAMITIGNFENMTTHNFHTTLQDAINAAHPTIPDVIKMLKNMTETNLMVDRSVTVETNGFELIFPPNGIVNILQGKVFRIR
jgi:trimeric autotransporter adhesin